MPILQRTKYNFVQFHLNLHYNMDNAFEYTFLIDVYTESTIANKQLENITLTSY